MSIGTENDFLVELDRAIYNIIIINISYFTSLSSEGNHNLPGGIYRRLSLAYLLRTVVHVGSCRCR